MAVGIGRRIRGRGSCAQQALIGQLADWRDDVAAKAAADGVTSVIGPFIHPSGFKIDDLLVNINRSGPPPTWNEALDAASVESHGLGGPWARLAYSLLSQVTHHTPVAALHAMEADGDDLRSGAISPQLEALAVDVGCLGACWLWAHLAILQFGAPMRSGDEFGPERYQEWVARLRQAAAEVHVFARPLHGLLNKRNLQGLGRNDRCRCGSGDKAKYCHLR